MNVDQRAGKNSRSRASTCSRRRVRLAVEPLEDRVVPYNVFGNGAVWSFTNLSYSYSNLLDGWASGFATNQQVNSAVQEAMGLWAAVSPLTFTEVRDSGPSPAGIRGKDTDRDDYDPIQFGQLLRWGHHFIDGDIIPGDLAHAHRPGDIGLAGDIHFDTRDVFSLVGTTAGFLEAAAHEFGHAIGLNHSEFRVVTP